MGVRRDAGRVNAIASEAARLIAEGQCTDHHSACRKAAERLGERDTRHWPDARAIEQALREYQALFQADRQPAELRRLRQLALAAMRDLAQLNPRLVGPVARGVADKHSGIRLLVSAETPETVAMALTDRRIPWQSAEVMLGFSRHRHLVRPAFRFQAGEVPLELVVLAPGDRQDPPRDPVDDGPLRGLSTSQLAELLGEDG